MPFTGTGTGIQNANDVFFSGLAQDNVLKYNNGTAKWNNTPVVGFAALAYNGGQETVSTQNATGATTLSLGNGNVFDVTLTGNATFSFTGATNGKACSFSLYLHQDAPGSRTVPWPATAGCEHRPRTNRTAEPDRTPGTLRLRRPAPRSTVARPTPAGQ